MSGAEVRQRIELRARAEGRADGIVAVGIHLHWTAAQIYRVAKACGVSFADAREALIRARDCTEAELTVEPRYPQEPERRVQNEVVPASLRTTRDRGHAPSRGMTMENPSGKRAPVRGDA